MKIKTLAPCLLAGIIGVLASSTEAAIVNYNFSGFAGNQTVNGYFALDTDVAADEDTPPIAIYALGDAPLVDFGLTLNIGGQSLDFFAQRPISNQDPAAGSIGRVINNQLTGVDVQGNAIFNDSLYFSVIDQGLTANPPNPVLSNVTTNDVVTYLLQADIDVIGTDGLINSLSVPSGIDFNEANMATLSIQIGSAIFDPNSNTYRTFDVTRATYALTDISVSQVPVPAAAWLFGSALLGLAGVSRKRAAQGGAGA